MTNGPIRIKEEIRRTIRRIGQRRRANSATKRGAKRIVVNTIVVNTMDHPASRRKIIRVPLATELLALLVCACASGSVWAMPPARDLFDAGRQAFEREDYESALRNFEAAAQAGLNTAGVSFNIGVAAYRAGHLDRARQAFTDAARDPSMMALAHYNLGLVARAEKNTMEANDWFRRVQQESSDERLLSLAIRQLDEADTPRELWWDVYLSAAIGYDDNVTLTSDSTVLNVSGKSDAFAEAQAGVNLAFDSPWQLDAGFSHVDYFEEDEYDLVSLFGGARYTFATNGWRHEGRVQISYSRLDNESFETRRSLAFQSTRDLDDRWRFRARYRFSVLDGMGARFAGLDGTRHEALARLSYYADDIRYSASYEYEINHQDEESLPERRHQFGIRAGRDLTPLWSVEFEAAVLRSQYASASYGRETLTELALSLERTLTSRWRLLSRYSYSDNDADSAELDYAVNQISVGLESSF